MIEIISLPGTKAFKRVVVAEYPRAGMKAFAFVTGSIKQKTDKAKWCLYSNDSKSNFWFLVYLPDEDIMETDMTIGGRNEANCVRRNIGSEQVEFSKSGLTNEMRKGSYMFKELQIAKFKSKIRIMTCRH